MLGLKRGTVRLIPHDSNWKTIFSADSVELLNLLGGHVVDIQHVGSTAVEGLVAKPILDIALGIRSWEDLPEVTRRLKHTPWIERGWNSADKSRNSDYLFIKDSAENTRSHHLHVMVLGSPKWSECLRFRDILRESPEIRDQYAQLKEALALQFEDNREAYTAAKKDFIESALRNPELAGK